MIEIGEKIRNRREILGLLQPDLAAMAGVSTRTIQLAEQGKGNPSLETIFNLTEALGLQLEIAVKIPNQ